MAEIIVNPAVDSAPVDIVCGNANAEVIRFVFDRYSEGIDLAGLAWSVTVKNAAGFSDVYMEGHGVSELEETADSISLKWMLFGVATGAAGRTTYMLEGLQGKALIKRFPVRVVNVLSYFKSELSDEAEGDNSALHETIEYVGNELPKILDAEAARRLAEAARVEAEAARTAAEEARAAAETARQQAETLRAEAFALLNLTVKKEGSVTTVTAVNTKGEQTTAQVKDGDAGEGTGDMLKSVYDPDGDGSVKLADKAKTAEDIPTPVATDAGKAIIVQADGSYGLGEAGSKDAVLYTAQTLTEEQKAQARENIGAGDTEITAEKITGGTFGGDVAAAATTDLTTPMVRNTVMTTEDPGAGVTVDYPEGTVIHVYE